MSGYLPIREYAVIGDGRTVALVARDGSIDWLCLPDIDSPSVFGGLLDVNRGGRFTLAPEGPHEIERRYIPETNVLETTFRTPDGVARLTDALTLPRAGLTPFRELVRRVEGLAGRVSLKWQVIPRFGYGAWRTRLDKRGDVLVATARTDAVAVCAWGLGHAQCDGASISGAFDVRAGGRATLALVAAHQEPLVFPSRAEAEARLDATIAFWKQWVERRHYDGPWSEAVIRSALALKLLIYAPSGAIAAAATTSLPEAIGGERNWDYRFCWIRDSAFTLAALLRLGCTAETHAFFWWFMHATQLTYPRLQVLYRLDGGNRAPELELPLEGYCGSRPVRIGNAAADQLQLDMYADLFETALLYAQSGNKIDRDTGHELAEVADLVCDLWQQPDRSIWEVRMEPRHFIHSKAMCWVALDRAIRLAAINQIPASRIGSWQRHASSIRQFIETRGWSQDRRRYVRFAGSDELDASLLLLPVMGYCDPRDDRILATIDAVRQELAHGPFLYRYTGEDGLTGSEGAFLTCSFWLVQALALAGRLDEATVLMEQLLALANDVGLHAEEIDIGTRQFLGNFPQGLVHLAVINAAMSFEGSHLA